MLLLQVLPTVTALIGGAGLFDVSVQRMGKSMFTRALATSPLVQIMSLALQSGFYTKIKFIKTELLSYKNHKTHYNMRSRWTSYNSPEIKQYRKSTHNKQ